MTELTKGKDYLDSTNYLSYILRRIRRGGIWHTYSSIMRQVRRLTFVSALVRIFGILFTLLEKSALLLLLFSSLLILIPAAVVCSVILMSACVVKYTLNHKKIKERIAACDKIVIFLTSSETRTSPLFMRHAAELSRNGNFQIFVLCRGRFTAFSDCAENITKIKPNYYFIIKSFYLKKYAKKTVYITLI